jgi:hypothetical protein
MKITRSQLALGGALGGALAVLVVVSIRSFASEPKVIPVFRPAACSACGFADRAELSDRPANCPKCGKKTLWPALRCAKCRQVVAMNSFRYDREGRDPYCLKCGSQTLQPMEPELAAQPPRKP